MGQMSGACLSAHGNHNTASPPPPAAQFCKDIEPGNARTKDCLEENREELSTGCKEEVDTMIERRVRDFRLDSRLRTVCETEIFNMCAYFGVSHAGARGRVSQAAARCGCLRCRGAAAA
jgi:hypothetical protein